MKLYVGIDFSSEKLDVCVLDSEDTILKECTLPNDLNGASILNAHILGLAEKTNYSRIIAGMESTSVYSFHPATFLAEDPELKALALEVVVMNRKSIHLFKGVFDEDKADTIDAYRIADFLRSERFTPEKGEVHVSSTVDAFPLSAGESDVRIQTAFVLKETLKKD